MRISLGYALLLSLAGCESLNHAIVASMSDDRMCYLVNSSEATLPGSKDAMRQELARRGVRCDPGEVAREAERQREAMEKLTRDLNETGDKVWNAQQKAIPRMTHCTRVPGGMNCVTY